jgi:predicted nucleotidyltransferase component of viral defense system
MNLFDQLVTEALKNQPELSPLRIVVEKELLHHDILRILSQNNLLSELTFIGGTCLRACYGGIRLSEDLDFTGGKNFSRDSLSTMGDVLTNSLNEKYGLKVIVSEPIKDMSNVDTWKIKVETRPQQTHLPTQRINIDICAVPSYEKQPMMLLNPYGIDMGTNGLVLQAQTREEIYADKLLAFALRPNRLKHRDLWDMVWLHQQGLHPSFGLIPLKLQDRQLAQKYFLNLFEKRLRFLSENNTLELEFKKEMHRFLSLKQINKTIEQDNLWSFIIYLIGDLGAQMRRNFVNSDI